MTTTLDGGTGLRRSPFRSLSRFLHRRRRVRLSLLLTAPTLWLVVAYLGALVALLVTSLFSINSFTSALVKKPGVGNFRELLNPSHAYRAITQRTIGIAVAVTVIDILIALPIAFYLAKVASKRVRSFAAVAIVLPLWASYLVKTYAWRAILTPSGGVADRWLGGTVGFGNSAVVIVLAYLWLPYMILPVYAGLERLPDSLLDASADLGAKAWTTFRTVIVPIVIPAIVAGSIFTFSLSMGDYIAVNIVGGKSQMLGTVVYRNFVDDLPLAATVSLVPVVVMFVYLGLARRTGAFENL